MSQQVNFSDLSADKKREFLNFLHSNNVQFQKETGSYVAKVTVQKGKAKENRQNRGSCSPIGKQQQTQGSSQKKRPLEPTKTNQEGSSAVKKTEIIVAPLPIKQKQQNARNSNVTISPASQRQIVCTEPQVERTRSRSKSANTRKTVSPSPSPPPHLRPKQQSELEARPKLLPELSSSKTKINSSLQIVKQNSQQNPPPKRQNSITPPHNTPPKTIQYQLYPPNKLQQLIVTLKICPYGFRPARWPRSQLLKTIQQIYSGNFAKNTFLLKHRKFKQAYDKGGCSFSSYVLQHFQQRLKTPKLIHNQLLNLCHSLLSYLHQPCNPPNGPSCCFSMFHLFLTDEYEYQDLVFFLFIRSIYEKEFSLSLDKAQEHLLTRREVGRLVRAILGRDSGEVVGEFQELLAEHMGDSIPVYTLFQVLLEDYQIKRRDRGTGVASNCYPSNTETGCTISPKNPHQNASRAPPTHRSKPSLPHCHSQSNFEQLTFGEYNISASCKVQDQDQTEFWNDFEPLQSVNDMIWQQLQEKLKRKVQELVQIMLGEGRDGGNSEAGRKLGRLILGKATRMLEAIINMDKIRWFKLIRVAKPSQPHLETVESLQMMLRNIRRLSKDNQQEARTLQSEFCKSLLTVQQLKCAIERIFIG